MATNQDPRGLLEKGHERRRNEALDKAADLLAHYFEVPADEYSGCVSEIRDVLEKLMRAWTWPR